MAPNNGVLNQPKTKLGTTLIFFAQEFHEVRVIPRTAQGSGYARICAATEQANASVQEHIKQTHTQALVNLSTSTTADRQAVGTLYTTNPTLTAEPFFGNYPHHKLTAPVNALHRCIIATTYDAHAPRSRANIPQRVMLVP